MQPQIIERSVQTSGGMSTGSFGISNKDQAHIIGILRDRLYSNKILAVTRELSANSADSMVVSGKGDQPIKVNLPTLLDPTFYVRDFGTGISEENIFNLYTQYGASTKRSDNDTVGSFGIGSKSPFCYSDSFTVTSWFDCMKKVYVCVIDETNIGTVTKLHEEPCALLDTGLEVSIPVGNDDIEAFKTTALVFYPYMTPLPIINIPLPVIEQMKGTEKSVHGWLGGTNYTGRHLAIMGCVPYRLNLDQIQTEMHKQKVEMPPTAAHLKFAIGEVDVTANREDLEYTPRTKAAIIAKMKLMYEECGKNMMLVTDDVQLSMWARRIRLQGFRSLFSLFTWTKSNRLAYDTEISLWEKQDREEVGGVLLPNPDEPKCFHFSKLVESSYRKAGEYGISLNPTSRIAVQSSAEILIVDTTTQIRRFFDPSTNLDYKYAVKPKDISTPAVDAAIAELHTLLAKHQLTGIPIRRLSEMTVIPREVRNVTQNAKHAQRCFKLNSDDSLSFPWSKHWEIEQWTPNEGDVYVVMDRFLPTHDSKFYDTYKEHQQILGFLLNPTVRDPKTGFTVPTVNMPTLYGIKPPTSALEKEIQEAGAITYEEWWASQLADAFQNNTRMRELIEHHLWDQIGGSYLNAKNVESFLGKTHPLMQLMLRHESGGREFHRINGDTAAGVRWLATNRGAQPVFVQKELKEITKSIQAEIDRVWDRYPFLNPKNSALQSGDSLVRNNMQLVRDYIQMIDTHPAFLLAA